jgi:hypothetical protein
MSPKLSDDWLQVFQSSPSTHQLASNRCGASAAQLPTLSRTYFHHTRSSFKLQPACGFTESALQVFSQLNASLQQQVDI